MPVKESVLSPFTVHKHWYTQANHALAPSQALSQKKEEKEVVDFIAKEIEKRGYMVTCMSTLAIEGDSPEDNIESYLISMIHNSDGIMVYGDEESAYDGIKRPGILAKEERSIFSKSVSITCMNSHRQIQWMNYYNTLTSWEQPVCELYTELDKDNIRKGIVNGSPCICNPQNWKNGISTIGNTLPNDIVQLLEDINKNYEEYDFKQVIDLEFEIPSFMMNYFTTSNFGKYTK